MMRLLRFKVTDFRSVVDSGWIDVGDVTALIGTNEAGKTNLLIPLWKLNPANDGEIDPIADIPRKRYSEIKNMEKKPIFIRAEFELDRKLVDQIVGICGCPAEYVRVAEVERDFGGQYYIGFPNEKSVKASKETTRKLLNDAHSEIEALSTTTQAEGALRQKVLAAVVAASSEVDAKPDEFVAMKPIMDPLEAVDTDSAPKRSLVVPRFEQLKDSIGEISQALDKPKPSSTPAARKLVLENLLQFVYYSNYGNLDSEIYLPHVIDNMEREDLGSKEQAKARTLRVLFDFVKLSPKEIRELGKDFNVATRTPTADELAAIAEKKKERSILLTSAASRLTSEFRNWWQQGDYVFDFQADGDHFRVWVSDDRRPEKIELENRSTGLQWFLSFFLVFLVESSEAHEGTMLLLDEPGLSLHPLAQKDLSHFFDNLSAKNQIAYTTHSPFLVDADHLDRVKAVYVDDQGATAVSANLRAAEGKEQQSRSVYPVHAALGLSVSTMLLEGCQPVIVEGASDQLCLSAAKTLLVAAGDIAPKREILFVPAGGAKGATTLASLLASRDETLPVALLDSDTIGKSAAKSLRDGLYKGVEGRVLLLGDLIGMDGAEVEDLLPASLVARLVSRQYFRTLEADFEDEAVATTPIVPQIEAFAKRNGVELPKGWKVEIAAQAKTRLLGGTAVDAVTKERWQKLFDAILA
jgi:predicted ATPase